MFSNSLRTFFPRSLGNAAVDLLFPPRCVICQQPLSGKNHDRPLLLCWTCRKTIRGNLLSRCLRCAVGTLPNGLIDGLCLPCRRQPPAFLSTITLGDYEGKLRELVLHVKRGRNSPLAFALADFLFMSNMENLGECAPDVVVPVPTHWRRRLVRGGSSPEVLASRLAAKLRILDEPRLVRRIRHTLPQAGLTVRQRPRNVKGAFRVARGFGIRGVSVLLVDDIMTSGSTCHETASVLIEAGAKSVGIAVLARAQMPRFIKEAATR